MNLDSKRLLDDLLREATPQNFRSDLLEEVLQRVRRRRHSRDLVKVVYLVVILGFVVSFALTRFSIVPRQVAVPDLKRPSFGLIHSAPLDPTMIIRTESRTVNLVSSSVSTVSVVSTHSTDGILKEIGDDELLHFLAGKPVMLVRPTPLTVSYTH